MYDSNHLGTRSFKKFWPGQGLTALMKIANEQTELLEQCVIKTSEGKEITMEEFLTELDKLYIVKE